MFHPYHNVWTTTAKHQGSTSRKLCGTIRIAECDTPPLCLSNDTHRNGLGRARRCNSSMVPTRNYVKYSPPIPNLFFSFLWGVQKQSHNGHWSVVTYGQQKPFPDWYNAYAWIGLQERARVLRRSVLAGMNMDPVMYCSTVLSKKSTWQSCTKKKKLLEPDMEN